MTAHNLPEGNQASGVSGHDHFILFITLTGILLVSPPYLWSSSWGRKRLWHHGKLGGRGTRDLGRAGQMTGGHGACMRPCRALFAPPLQGRETKNCDHSMCFSFPLPVSFSMNSGVPSWTALGRCKRGPSLCLFVGEGREGRGGEGRGGEGRGGGDSDNTVLLSLGSRQSQSQNEIDKLNRPRAH